MSTIFYTVLLQDGFPVRFISAGQVGNFNGPFADPGEACQEFECCYQPGATRYLEPAVFDMQSAGLPAFAGQVADEKREENLFPEIAEADIQAVLAHEDKEEDEPTPERCSQIMPVCRSGLLIQAEATRLYGWLLEAHIQKLPQVAIDIRQECWKYIADLYDSHLEECPGEVSEKVSL